MSSKFNGKNIAAAATLAIASQVPQNATAAISYEVGTGVERVVATAAGCSNIIQDEKNINTTNLILNLSNFCPGAPTINLHVVI